MRRRIWCETLTYASLLASDVLPLLAARSVELVLAVRPWDVAALPEVLRACRAAGVAVSVWPMLDDADGRWASAENAEAYAAFAERVAAAMPPVDRGTYGLVVDLEPPIARARMALEGKRGAARAALAAARAGRSFDPGTRTLVALVDSLASRGVTPWAAVLPTVLRDAPGARATWQTLLGAPIYAPRFAHVHAMLYTSMFEGWSRGLVDRAASRAILAAGCHAVRARFGDRAGVSLGAVGPGAFGDEPAYRSPDELADDVSIARACGIDDIALFDLGGAVARPPVSAWLAALLDTSPASRVPGPTLSSRVLFGSAGIGGS